MASAVEAGARGSAPAIELVEVSKEFDDGTRCIRALDRVSLTVAQGECAVIVGRSGSGKSTLLHVLGGLDVPTSGEVRLDGLRLADLDDSALAVMRRRRIGFVFQLFNLLPGLTAEENVAVPLLLDGVTPRRARERARQMLERVGLEYRAHHQAAQLSGGEMQRVALARALVIEPAVVLADEPTGSLDGESGKRVLGLLTDLVRMLGRSMVMVTHDTDAAAVADRVLTLQDGRLVNDHEPTGRGG